MSIYYSSYYIYMIPALIISLLAQFFVNSSYSKYSGVMSRSGLSGADVARKILRLNGINDVMIECISGKLTDHYDPSAKALRLSSDVFNGTSVASIGVAAHECGHAIQHSVGYLPIKLRMAIIPITNFGSKLALPLVILGSLIYSPTIAEIGVLMFCFVVLFQLVTLPVEFNASRRAIKTIGEENILMRDEIGGAKTVLFAAALTYVASLISVILTLLRLLAIAGNSKRRR